MDAGSNANTNEDAPPPPSPSRRGGEHLESASRAAQDLMMETEDRAIGSTAAAATINTTATTNHESCTTTGVSDMHAFDDHSSDNQQSNKADMSKSANDSNIASFPSTVRGADQPTQSDNNSDIEEHPDKPTDHTDRKSTNASDVISIVAGPGCLLPPSFIGVLDNETEEDRQRRRAVFAARRQRHVLANNLHAHYEAILAAVGVGEGEEQQENNNEDNAASFHQNAARPARHIMAVAMDLFMEMETDDEEESKAE